MQIELLKTHTHQGQPLPPGQRIDLDTASANWLIERGVAKAVTSSSKPINPKPSRKGD